jgi:ribosomal protein L11 methyltransferase
MDDRLDLMRAELGMVPGTWPLVVANVLAAPLMEMAPALVRRVGTGGQLVLSGIPASLEQDVTRTYRRLGMQGARVLSRAGWTALVLRTSW